MKKSDLRPCSITYHHDSTKHFEALFHRWFESNNGSDENILFAIVEINGGISRVDMSHASLMFTD